MKNLGTLIVVLMLFPLLGWAQEDKTSTEETTTSVEADQVQTPEAQQANPPKKSGEKVEKIEVTGSHIKRIDVEGPSPVLTLDREYLDRTGYNSVADVLRDTTVAGLGGAREYGLGGSGSAGTATTSVRGMGAENILVLLDGKRLPTIGGSTTVDLNLIPMAAIDRVDILKDGASAIYGSDALGGVINFITKKDYDGASVALQHAQPEEQGGAKSDVTATYGKSGSKYNFLSVLQYRKNQSVAMRDRDFFVPTADYFSPTGSPGSYKNHADPETSWKADPNCITPLDGRGKCTFDYSPYMNALPELEQTSALLKGGYKFNENFEAFGRLLATRRVVKTRLAPPPDGFRDERNPDGSGLDTRVPKAVADGWGLPGGDTTVNGTSPGNDVDVVYRLVEEVGSRLGTDTTDSYGLNSGVKGYIGESWDWELSGNYAVSKIESKGTSGYANKVILRNMAINNPVSFNPFAAPGAKSNIDAARYNPVTTIESSVTNVLLSATGEAFDIWAGPVAVAVGASANWQTFDQGNDEVTTSGAQWGGGTANNGGGLRDFQSGYVEFSFPLLERLELQTAGRFDNYSDFGSTVNPKVALRYKPFNSLMLRTSWGTGFKAPALEQLYGQQTVDFPFGVDVVTGQTTSEQFKVFGGGNRNLKQETSDSFNAGFVWQILKSLSFGTDYYFNNQENIVSSGSLRDIFNAELNGSDLNSLGIFVIRNPANTGSVERIVAPFVNLASRKTEGLEFRLSYNLPLWGGWNAYSIVDYSLLLKLRESPFPGVPMQDRLGWQGNPYWRNNVAIGATNNKWAFNGLVRTVGEQDKDPFTPGNLGKTRDHTELDLQAEYNFAWKGSAALGVRNVFNTDRPWMSEHLSSGFLDTGLYDPFGRTVFMRYSQDF